MLKRLFVFILGMMCWQGARAQVQKQDTLLYYLKNNKQMVASKDSADYFLFIMPQDNLTKLYPIVEYYPNGKPKLRGTSSSNKFKFLNFEGPQITYFSNGRRENITTYKNGKPIGVANEYFPNGQLYYIVDYGEKNDMKFVECRDTSGNAIAENGKGKWVYFNWDKKKITGEGFILDSLREGEWRGSINDTGKYVCLFKKDKSVSGTGYDKEGRPHPFTNYEVEPSAKGGPVSFNEFLGKTLQFPAVDRENGIQGKVIVTFVVDRDGRLKDITALRGPSESMKNAAVTAVSLSPRWQPGLLYGMPFRVQYTISFAFSLANN